MRREIADKLYEYIIGEKEEPNGDSFILTDHRGTIVFKLDNKGELLSTDTPDPTQDL